MSTKAAPPPAKKPAAPPPAQPAGGGGMLSGLASTVMQGMAFGTGSAVAHRAVDAVAGPREMKVVHENQGGEQSNDGTYGASNEVSDDYSSKNECDSELTDFNKCIKENSGNLASCRFFYDILTQCQSNQSNSDQWS